MNDRALLLPKVVVSDVQFACESFHFIIVYRRRLLIVTVDGAISVTVSDRSPQRQFGDEPSQQVHFRHVKNFQQKLGLPT